jgi:PPP family 3-phenylpropionic acid transporter
MRKIWPFTFYLLYFGGNAFFLPYLVLYYQSLNFSATQIGLLIAISPLITLVGAPFWTGIADITHRHKLVMSTTILLMIVLTLMYPIVKTITAVFTLVILFSFMVAPINSLADTATISMLGDESQMYGRIRVGGTIGWGVAAPIAGVLIGRYGLNWAFWSYAIVMFIGFIVSQKFVFNPVKQESSFKHGLRALLSNRRLILFLFTAFICGMALTSINVYLFAYMEQLEISKTLMGIALGIATVSELPMFFYSDKLLARFKPHGLLIIAMIVTALRLFLYAIFNSTAGILVFQLINGVTFSAVWVAGVSYASENAPVGLSATAQGVFGAVLFGFGSAAGGFLSAILFEKVGGAQMYAIFGALISITLLIYLFLEKRIPKVQYA